MKNFNFDLRSIKLWTFDFWETLYHDNNELEEERYNQRLKILTDYCSQDQKVKINEIDRLYKNIEKSFFDAHKNKPFKTFCLKDIVKKVLIEHGVPISNIDQYENIETLLRKIDEVCLDIPPILSSSAKDMLIELKKHSALAIISNTEGTTGSTLRKLMVKDDVYDLFSKFSFSDEVGVIKPYETIFHQTIKYFEVPPELVCHVGDSLENDYYGASKYNMNAILLDINSTNKDPNCFSKISNLKQITEKVI